LSTMRMLTLLIPACELKEFGSVYGRTTDPGLSSELRPMSSVATGTPADFTTQPAILDFQRGMNVATFAGHWHAFGQLCTTILVAPRKALSAASPSASPICSSGWH